VRHEVAEHRSGILSVAVDVDQALVADPEVVRDLVEDDTPHLLA
jgi:hypothetical protein